MFVGDDITFSCSVSVGWRKAEGIQCEFYAVAVLSSTIVSCILGYNHTIL